MSERLNRLCELAGIQPDYHDIWGRRHELTDATRLALLDAMGFITAAEEPDYDSAITAAEASKWLEALPPVHVGWTGQPLCLTFRLPESDSANTWHWRVTLENGEVRHDKFKPDELERTETYSNNGQELIAVTLALPELPELGYHQLELHTAGRSPLATKLIVCPHSVYLPDIFADGDRVWGLAVQLYALRTRKNWGLGDYGDLCGTIDWAAQHGASLVGLNPLHALFPHNPRHCSPYSPSSRQFQNVLHLDVEGLPEFEECAKARKKVASHSFQSWLSRLRQCELIDYQGAADAKFEVLDLLYHHFRDHHLKKGTPRAQAFRAYLEQGGEELHMFSLYHALQDHFFERDNSLWGWPAWPEAYRQPDSDKVAAFAKKHAKEVEWHSWLQWLTDEQLAAASRRAEDKGMAIGLYQDLAVGVDKGGAETWMHQDMYAMECRIGCPPDDFNLLGQDWGLPPWIPQKLRAAAYRPYIAMLRANMKHSGALRIDHVMGLMRLYWIPPGMKGDAGGYLSYPFSDLLGILALESHRNRCVVVGEDLGTVPGELRQAMHEAGILSYRLFYFERQHDGHFMPPAWYPEQALVAVTTHDLPTLKGYWAGRDIEVRTELDLFPNEEVRLKQINGRIEDKCRLLADLAREGLLPEGVSTDPDEVPELTPPLIQAILRYIARTPSRLALIQAEDMMGVLKQANLPGTMDEHPNWRRKLPLELEAWSDDPGCLAAAAVMTSERGLD
jgi:(1->4)-alpha-D-glucan 1-alpha-D-glucosylmutase